MPKICRTILIFSLLNLSYFSATAEVRLPAIIGSHMVLPQNREVTIWGWAKPWEVVKIRAGWDTATYMGTTDFRTAKWELKINTPKAGGPYKIIIKGENEIILEDVLVGEVWLCGGQSNMELSANDGIQQAKDESMNATNSMIRFFYVPKYSSASPQDDTKGKWVVCNPDDMKKLSAVGYFFGKRLQTVLQQPVGLINANWGGTGAEIWSPAELINNNDSFKEVAAMAASTNECCPNGIGLLYNGMIHPIVNYKISGVIWYQGETNRFSYTAYPSLLKSMVNEWRRLWQYDFPFYYVQIAPFSDIGTTKNYVALMRDAQTKCMEIPRTGMVVISDLVDDINNVHPQNKSEVGLRLANYALAETYDKNDIAYKSPFYKSMEIKKDKIHIRFENAANELISKGGSPSEFFIAGNDKIFLPAVAVIDGSTIVVSNKKIKNPVAVRFGFNNAATPNLFNKEGLPVNLFRTDAWDVSLDLVINKTEKPIIGAIRWDAWYYGSNTDNITGIIEKNLMPKEFRNRLPFFAKEIGKDSLYINGSSQEVMDKEINYAKIGALDYWAFVTYTEEGLKLGLERYLSSKHRADINFCLIIEQGRFRHSNTGFINHMIKMMKEPGYQTVLNNRPLLYFGFIDSADVIKNWGSFLQMKTTLDSVRNIIAEAGLGNPYLVIMDFDEKKGKQWSDSLGGNALSSYVAQKNSPKASYKKLTEEAEQFWNECKTTGSQVVPVVNAGWNPKPRIDNISIWSKYYPKDVYYNHAVPNELAAHVETALQWLIQNRTAAVSQCALVYAWNEFDEGGWLCPTLYEGDARVKAVGKAIQKFKSEHKGK